MVVTRLPPSAEDEVKASKRSRDDGEDVSVKQSPSLKKNKKSSSNSGNGADKAVKKNNNSNKKVKSGGGGPKVKLWRIVDAAPTKGGASDWLKTLYEASGKGMSKIELYPGGNRIQAEDIAWQEDSRDALLAAVENCNALVICASALRACSVIKTLSKRNRPVAKLFSKHMSVSDQASFCKKQRPQIAVGTPNRLIKLAEIGALDHFLSDPKAVIVLDIHLDIKKFSVVTMPTVSQDTFTFLRNAWLTKTRATRPKLALSSSE